jgi:hypothetical protein
VAGRQGEEDGELGRSVGSLETQEICLMTARERRHSMVTTGSM